MLGNLHVLAKADVKVQSLSSSTSSLFFMLPLLLLCFRASHSVVSRTPESREVSPSSLLGSKSLSLELWPLPPECRREPSGLVVCSSSIPEGGCFQSPPLKDRFQIDPDDEFLGSGSFGVVERGKDVKTSESVAVKTSRINPYKSVTAATLRREAELSLELSSHPKLVSTLAAVLHEDGLCLVMKKYDKSLSAWLSRLPRFRTFGQWMDEAPARTVFRQVVEGLASMHSLGPGQKGVAHNDLRTDNVLIEEGQALEGGPEVVLADLGLSEKFENIEGWQKRNFVGTLNFLPPRLREYKWFSPMVPVTERDLYSLGVFLYEFFTNAFINLEFVAPEVAPEIRLPRGALYRKVPIFDRFRLSNLVGDLLTRLLTGDPVFIKGGAMAVLQHPWFSASRATLVQQVQANLWDEDLFRLSVINKEGAKSWLDRLRQHLRAATGRLLVPPTSLRYPMRGLHAYLPSSGVDFSSGSAARHDEEREGHSRD